MRWLPRGRRIYRLCCVLLLMGAGPSADVLVTNHAAIAMAEIYVSGSEDDSWGNNRLGGAVAAGQSVHLAPLRSRGCKFDLRVIYSDGSVEDKRGVDACRTHQFVFDAATAIAPPALAQSHAPRRVMLTNRAARAIVEVYVSSAASDDWGNDLVAQRPIVPAGSGEIRPDVSCLADLRVVFDNRSAEERRDLDLCAHAKLEIKPGWTTNEDVPLPVATARVKPPEPP